MNPNDTDTKSDVVEEESKWAYFRKLRDLKDEELNDENVRQLIVDNFEHSKSSILSDELNAMEKTLRLSTMKDKLTANIIEKIGDAKDRMLVKLLYKVCNEQDPTRMQFIHFCILLHQHGILNDLRFLTNYDDATHPAPPSMHHAYQQPHTYHLDEEQDQFSVEWTDDESEEEEDDDDDEETAQEGDEVDQSENHDNNEPQTEHTTQSQQTVGAQKQKQEEHDETMDDTDIQSEFDALSVNTDDPVFRDKFSDLHGGHLYMNHNDEQSEHDLDDFDHAAESNYDHEAEEESEEQTNDLQLIRLKSLQKRQRQTDRNLFYPLSTPTKSATSVSMKMNRYHRDFEEMECIGYGAFGTVYQCKHKLDSRVYAIKKILYKHTSTNHDDIKNQIIREVTNIAALQHDNIVRYFSSWIEPVMITTEHDDDEKVPKSETMRQRRNDRQTHSARSKQRTPKNRGTAANVLKFFEFYESAEARLNPTGQTPLIRVNKSANEELQVLLSSDAAKSLLSPYPSRHTSPTPRQHKARRISPARHGDLAEVQDDEVETQLVAMKDIKDIYNYWQNQTSYSCLFLQTEYCGRYTLKDFINTPTRIVDRDDNMHLFAQILLGVAHIHSKNILHRDLKPENIFLVHDDNNTITAKIGDFGLSKSIQDSLIDTHLHYEWDNTNLNINDLNDFAHKSSSNLTSNTGTEVYAAPEQLHNDVYGTAADIYSLGIILFELIQPPFDTQMERRIAINRFRDDQFIDEDRIDRQKFGKEIELMINMTNKNPQFRRTAHSLILDQFIQVYWMKKVLNAAIPEMPPFPQTQQRSLEYIEPRDRSNSNIQVSVVRNCSEEELDASRQSLNSNSLGHQENAPPSLHHSPGSCFLVSSPSTPPDGNGGIPPLEKKMSPLIQDVKVSCNSLLEQETKIKSCSL
eukprot:CAMPEP_0197035300 /NCGR_PEP_ID=MMETSP1384-20130603/13145_1 /TAXON_ID=29189 /ORGANISM="Ammonia sp." /LENGTH=913 /DNA_ID=CAMNT_0042465345 /DNA_START=77 /DNA_END=2818 /DNA_ORIENTATION=-